MKFVIKYFPEIIIKSKSVRILLSKKLESNIRNTCKRFAIPAKVVRGWDKMEVTLAPEDEARFAAPLLNMLKCTPGIEQFHEVMEFDLIDFDHVGEKVVAHWADKIVGQSFVVRIKRKGNHNFTSTQMEQVLGGYLLSAVEDTRVDIRHADITVRLEVIKDRVFLITQTHRGMGGYPLGSQSPVLALMSGGYDSGVAAYQTMSRGCYTHFVFFNLGGAAHEVGVKQAALYLWSRYGAAAKVKFVTVRFEAVVGAILQHIDDGLMGVVLKRMMVKAASKVARELNLHALVTGEAIAQVSSQTLRNLAVIEEAADVMILRPLITTSKPDIIQLAREIGTEEFARNK